VEISASEAKNKLGMLLDRVEAGEEVIITRHGKPIARLVSNTAEIGAANARAALERIRARSGECSKPFDWAALKADRDAGRL
jgi:prevent-host-death family protein